MPNQLRVLHLCSPSRRRRASNPFQTPCMYSACPPKSNVTPTFSRRSFICVSSQVLCHRRWCCPAYSKVHKRLRRPRDSFGTWISPCGTNSRRSHLRTWTSRARDPPQSALFFFFFFLNMFIEMEYNGQY